MTSETISQKTITEILQVPEEMRWIDLSAHGMSWKMAYHRDGSVLVVQGGDSAADALESLGFTRMDGEWMSSEVGFSPRAVLNRFPEGKVVKMPTYEILLDRRDRDMPALPAQRGPLARLNENFNQKVAAAVASAPDAELAIVPKFWFAKAELLDQDVHGFGSSPEVAMSALVAAWNGLAERERLDPSILSEYREDITVSAVAMGKGYAKGIGDSGWYDEVIIGSDERFATVLDGLASAPAATPRAAPKP
jgi:hypothetical protein